MCLLRDREYKEIHIVMCMYVWLYFLHIICINIGIVSLISVSESKFKFEYEKYLFVTCIWIRQLQWVSDQIWIQIHAKWTIYHPNLTPTGFSGPIMSHQLKKSKACSGTLWATKSSSLSPSICYMNIRKIFERIFAVNDSISKKHR